MLGRDADGIDDDAVDPLPLQADDIGQLFFLFELAHQQQSLVARRLQHPVDAGEQFAHGYRIHARQHDADEFALLHLEPLRKEV